jgi:hypothetical protein
MLAATAGGKARVRNYRTYMDEAGGGPFAKGPDFEVELGAPGRPRGRCVKRGFPAAARA